MVQEGEIKFYMCPRHLVFEPEPGQCPEDPTLDLVECRPGEPDDPCRRPLLAGDGSVLTRAPLWWLEHTVEELWPYIKPE